MQRKFIIITGVSGTGKTTISKSLGERLSIDFWDADNFHPEANKSKMAQGQPLTDEDRWPWLEAMNHAFSKSSQDVILACSALKASYRSRLVAHLKADIYWLHLTCSEIVLAERLQKRTNHFFNHSLLTSQLETYEFSSYGLQVDAKKPIDEILATAIPYIQQPKTSFGLIGLGVMGTSLAQNIACKGHTIAIYNRHVDGTEENIAVNVRDQYDALKDAQAFDDLGQFCDQLSSPKRIMLMVNAGAAIDDVVQQLLPYCHPGDCIIDGGNSHYKDTERRVVELSTNEVDFIGCGISGGEEGALLGPSIMVGGNEAAYLKIENILTSIAARNPKGEICCSHIGNGGAGHFVKMVHNGIEYAEMQAIAEMYSLLRHDLGFDIEEIADIFEHWCDGELSSYLLEITIDILRFNDNDGSPLVDKIKDVAHSKGTGAWTTEAALQMGVAIPGLTQALNERFISTLIHERQQRYSIYKHQYAKSLANIDDLEKVYFFVKLMHHHQGLSLIKQANDEHHWNVKIDELLKIWSAGCIIRSTMIEKIRLGMDIAHENDILQHEWVIHWIKDHIQMINTTVSSLAASMVSTPIIQSSLQYFKSMTTHRSSADLIQAQRDYFGAHTYQRIDDPLQTSHHTNWKNK